MLSKSSKILLGSIVVLVGILGLAGILGFRYYQSQPAQFVPQVEDKEDKCEKLKNQIFTLIEKANYCVEDSDCLIAHFDCPFGCYSLINKNADLRKIKKEIKNYFKKCPMCKYKCGSSPKQEEIKCKNGKCIDIRFKRE